ncbi:GNAT family N-acetyltransferase [Halapricum hydrolyticum]|uniref:GNAT family N-acetyltransferase n=1 Tax=Halapricum hydrolyticum TaxID=2979991 RepID=A0AAE3IGX8_9EURY|nr:GNAT family N-acetyltransferase [Halapricum hydrolyticum]MCU4719536.1 GNAT family N-acetyltransferase [Halapricum hydrolyticum]MCU4728180.1 GNAT family N-acetyltransferase [Halapricum hydrolyticum]
MLDVSVRTARPGDAEAILDVKRTAIAELAASAYTREQLRAWAPGEALEEYRAATTTDAFQVLVACDDGVVGYGVLNTSGCRIEGLFVHPLRARTGIGTRLLGLLETSATLTGCRDVSVISSLNATGFYESREYVRIEDRRREMDDVGLEFVLLEKRLSQ